MDKTKGYEKENVCTVSKFSFPPKYLLIRESKKTFSLLSSHTPFLQFLQGASFAPSGPTAGTHVPEMLSSTFFSYLSFKLRLKIIFSWKPSPKSQTSLRPFLYAPIAFTALMNIRILCLQLVI